MLTEIRNATLEDRDLFLQMWMELLMDVEKLGGEIVPNQKAAEAGGRLFDDYVSGEFDGIVLFADDVGLLMWGELAKEPLFDSRFGRLAQGWGTYVRREARMEGVASTLRMEGRRQLKELGFDGISGTTHMGNEPGILSTAFAGFTPYSTNVVLRF